MKTNVYMLCVTEVPLLTLDVLCLVYCKKMNFDSSIISSLRYLNKYKEPLVKNSSVGFELQDDKLMTYICTLSPFLSHWKVPVKD